MKTEKLILNYQRRGIKLSVSDNKLHFSAPQNILTDEDKDILKKNKKEIIKFIMRLHLLPAGGSAAFIVYHIYICNSTNYIKILIIYFCCL